MRRVKGLARPEVVVSYDDQSARPGSGEMDRVELGHREM